MGKTRAYRSSMIGARWCTWRSELWHAATKLTIKILLLLLLLLLLFYFRGVFFLLLWLLYDYDYYNYSMCIFFFFLDSKTIETIEKYTLISYSSFWFFWFYLFNKLSGLFVHEEERVLIYFSWAMYILTNLGIIKSENIYYLSPFLTSFFFFWYSFYWFIITIIIIKNSIFL